MKNFILTISLILFGFLSACALESQIILINSEAYLVDLDENFDVVNIHDRIPEYFQDHSSHEEILATYSSPQKHRDIGCQFRDDKFIKVPVSLTIELCSSSALKQSNISFQEDLHIFKLSQVHWMGKPSSTLLSLTIASKNQSNYFLHPEPEILYNHISRHRQNLS